MVPILKSSINYQNNVDEIKDITSIEEYVKELENLMSEDNEHSLQNNAPFVDFLKEVKQLQQESEKNTETQVPEAATGTDHQNESLTNQADEHKTTENTKILNEHNNKDLNISKNDNNNNKINSPSSKNESKEQQDFKTSIDTKINNLSPSSTSEDNLTDLSTEKNNSSAESSEVNSKTTDSESQEDDDGRKFAFVNGQYFSGEVPKMVRPDLLPDPMNHWLIFVA